MFIQVLRGGVMREITTINDLKIEGDYFFIVHMLDRVLVGECKDNKLLEKVEKGIEEKNVIEGHFFNDKGEVFIAQVDGQLMAYDFLEHIEEKGVIRKYRLDNSISNKYTSLLVKEYIEYDKENHMAYVDKTIAYELQGRDKDVK